MDLCIIHSIRCKPKLVKITFKHQKYRISLVNKLLKQTQNELTSSRHTQIKSKIVFCQHFIVRFQYF